ncbi:MAG: tetratricopeptide repeat protein [Myxococcota bacterium]
MNPVIESATPFDRSILWELHHAYFANRGIEAWKAGEIPFFSTSNAAYATQHARLFQAHVKDLEAAGLVAPGAPVTVMECAGGVGVFAANFLFAIDDMDPALAARVHYVFTDYVAKNVLQAVAAAPLARWYRAGKVIPARFDVTRPSELQVLDGTTVPDKPVFVICNYLCCVLPMKHLSLRGGSEWNELMVTVGGIADDEGAVDRESFLASIARNPTRKGLMEQVDVVWDWEPTELVRVLPDPRHQQAIVRAIDNVPEATVGWPVRYFDFLAGVESLLHEGGAVLTSDFGTNDRRKLAGRTTGRPHLYGNTLNQPVNMSLFSAWAEVTGLHLLSTVEDLTSLNSALTSRRAFGPAVAAAFPALYMRLGAGDDVLDYWAAAIHFHQGKEHLRSLRFWLRCADLDKRNPEHRYRLGEAAIELGQPDRAVIHLLIGYDLDVDFAWDFDFQLGRAYAMAGDHASAIKWYELSAVREATVTWTNLGVIQMHQGLFADAYHSLRQRYASTRATASPSSACTA